MLPIVPTRPNAYTGSPLDRVSDRREDEAWVAATVAAPETLFAPVWRARNLMRGVTEGHPEAVFVTGEAADALRMENGPWVLLGLRAGIGVVAIDLSAVEDPVPLLPPEAGTFTDLRQVGGMLPSEDAPVLAHARGMLHWRARHRFCGICGAPCAPRSAGNVMACTACDASHFPRTDPAVIMLVVDGERALLGNSARFNNPIMYSTLAGFVEPGESLEEAVAREVAEETGVRVGRVHYHSSQPWPFPSSLMLGFVAEASSTDIIIDPKELSDAKWFTRDQIRNPAAHGFSLPRADSIARRLIEDWAAS